MSNLDRFKGSLIPTLYFFQSSNIIGIGYDKENEDLYVLFGNKKVYKYSGVPEQTFQDFYYSPSKGKFLAVHIKNSYPVQEAYKTDGYLVTDYKEDKIVITDLDDGRGYIYIDGVRHDMFDAGPGAVEKCYICGAKEPDVELTTCDTCKKTVCIDSKKCSESFSMSGSTECRKCLDTRTKYDCSTCYTQKYEDCPFGGDVQWCYDCPEYIELTEELKIKDHLKEIIALELEVHFDAVSDEYNLKDDLDIESEVFKEIIKTINYDYPCIKITDLEAVELETKTVEEIIEYITKKIEEAK